MAELAPLAAVERPTPRRCEIPHTFPSIYFHYSHIFLPPHITCEMSSTRSDGAVVRGTYHPATHALRAIRITPRFRIDRLHVLFVPHSTALDFPTEFFYDNWIARDMTVPLSEIRLLSLFRWCPIYALTEAPLRPGSILLERFCHPGSYLFLPAKTCTLPHCPYCEVSVGDCSLICGDYSEAG